MTHRLAATPPRPRRHSGFWIIYTLSVLFSFHSLIVAYSNSSFMERFTTTETIGLLYSAGSAVAVILFLFIAHILQRLGNYRLTLLFAGIEVLCLLALAMTSSSSVALVAFLGFLVVSPMLYLNIDIFSESLIGDEEHSTGSKRGLTLTLMSMASVFGPLTMGFLVGDDSSLLFRTYLVSAAVLSVFMILVMLRFRTFEDPPYKTMNIAAGAASFWRTANLRNVFLAHFLLQVFFSWMVIYVPLYLATVVGFSWETIGVILAVGLTAYVVFEYPVGLIADRYIGEKEMMVAGFIIIALTTLGMSVFVTGSVALWMMLMFINRAGASLVEATTESYFFKHTTGSDANIVSFFRLTRPLATLVGALFGSVALMFMPLQFIFICLGAVLFIGIWFAAALVDTK